MIFFPERQNRKETGEQKGKKYQNLILFYIVLDPSLLVAVLIKILSFGFGVEILFIHNNKVTSPDSEKICSITLKFSLLGHVVLSSTWDVILGTQNVRRLEKNKVTY